MAILNQALFSRSNWFCPLPVMMIEGPINALVLSSFGHSLNGSPLFMEGLWLALLKKPLAIWFLRYLQRKEV